MFSEEIFFFFSGNDDMPSITISRIQRSLLHTTVAKAQIFESTSHSSVHAKDLRPNLDVHPTPSMLQNSFYLTSVKSNNHFNNQYIIEKNQSMCTEFHKINKTEGSDKLIVGLDSSNASTSFFDSTSSSPPCSKEKVTLVASETIDVHAKLGIRKFMFSDIISHGRNIHDIKHQISNLSSSNLIYNNLMPENLTHALPNVKILKKDNANFRRKAYIKSCDWSKSYKLDCINDTTEVPIVQSPEYRDLQIRIFKELFSTMHFLLGKHLLLFSHLLIKSVFYLQQISNAFTIMLRRMYCLHINVCKMLSIKTNHYILRKFSCI